MSRVTKLHPRGACLGFQQPTDPSEGQQPYVFTPSSTFDCSSATDTAQQSEPPRRALPDLPDHTS